MCKKTCDRCIYETQEQMDRRLASSGGGITVIVNVGSGATTPSPSVPDQIIYYKKHVTMRLIYIMILLLLVIRHALVNQNRTCPTGYVKTKDSQGNVICIESPKRHAINRKIPIVIDIGIHYEIRTFNTVGADCPSGWRPERFDCPPIIKQ